MKERGSRADCAPEIGSPGSARRTPAAPAGAHTPPRFFVEPSMVLGAQIVLSGDVLRHAKAQRLERGETFTAVLGDTVYSAEVAEVLPDRLVASITGRMRVFQPKGEVHLYASLLKGQSFDLVVEKATELGAASITPVVTRRTIPRLSPPKSAERKDRWAKIARSASEQSGRASVPIIGEIVEFSALMVRAKASPVPGASDGGSPGENGIPGVRLFGHEHEGLTVDVGQAVRGHSEASVLIGPEGGLDADEVRAAIEAGFVPISLGPYILKAETAALAAVSLLIHYLCKQG